jgi:hypothetical protein
MKRRRPGLCAFVARANDAYVQLPWTAFAENLLRLQMFWLVENRGKKSGESLESGDRSVGLIRVGGANAGLGSVGEKTPLGLERGQFECLAEKTPGGRQIALPCFKVAEHGIEKVVGIEL